MAFSLLKMSGRVLVWVSFCGEVQTCMWSRWCHCHSLSLASVKSRLLLTFCYRLTRVVPDKGLLNVLLLLLLYVITGSITRRYISYSEAAVEVFAPQGRHVAPMGVQHWPWTEGPLLHGTPARQVSPPSVQR